MRRYLHYVSQTETILRYMEAKLCANPPEPFILAGRMVKDLKMRRSDLYVALGQLIGTHLWEYREGKKKYYYLLEMVRNHRVHIKKERLLPISRATSN